MGFTEGQIVSPSDADWNVETVAGLHRIAAVGRQNEDGFARYRAAERGGVRPLSGGVAAFAHPAHTDLSAVQQEQR